MPSVSSSIPAGQIDPAEFVSVTWAAARLGMSAAGLRKAIRAGRFPAFQTPTGAYLIRRADVVLRPAAVSQ